MTRIKNLDGQGDVKGTKSVNDFSSDTSSPSGKVKNDISSGLSLGSNVSVKNDPLPYGSTKDKSIRGIRSGGQGDGGSIKNLNK